MGHRKGSTFPDKQLAADSSASRAYSLAEGWNVFDWKRQVQTWSKMPQIRIRIDMLKVKKNIQHVKIMEP